MSWFKRKERSLIPPVQEPPSSGPGGYTSSYRSNVSTYNASRDGNLYNPPSRTPIGRSSSSLNDGYEKPTRDLDRGSTNPYRREERDRDGDRNELFSGRGSRSELFTGNSSRSDSYSQNEPEVDADRRELFAGYNPEKAGQNRFTDGPPRRKSPPPGEEGDEDVEVIKQDIRATKQDGLNSTRNALRLAREAEETAINTLGRLGDQSEKLANTEFHLDGAKGHTDRAGDNTSEIKQLNKSIFRPAITFNKQAKRDKQAELVQRRREEELADREEAMRDVRDTQNRVGRAMTGRGGDGGDDEESIGGVGRGQTKTVSEQNIRKEQRKRYQFEATASDDELEDELDDNLGEISDAAKRLKGLGLAMGQELDKQNVRIGRLETKTTRLDDKVTSTTERLKRIR